MHTWGIFPLICENLRTQNNVILVIWHAALCSGHLSPVRIYLFWGFLLSYMAFDHTVPPLHWVSISRKIHKHVYNRIRNAKAANNLVKNEALYVRFCWLHTWQGSSGSRMLRNSAELQISRNVCSSGLCGCEDRKKNSTWGGWHSTRLTAIDTFNKQT